MNDYEKGTQTARGWKAKKYYLSDEAIALLMEHCSGTPLTMSAYLDGLIKRELGSPAEQFLRAQPVAEVAKVLEEGQRQIEELTDESSVMTPERAEIAAEIGRRPRPAHFGEMGADEAARRLKAMRIAEERAKQPTKKDFDIDV